MDSIFLFFIRIKEIIRYGCTLEQMIAKVEKQKQEVKQLQSEIEYYTKLKEARDKAVKDWSKEV